MDNTKRSERAFRALLTYEDDAFANTESTEEALTDLITDMMHLAEEYCIDMQAVINMAKTHYETETEAHT